MAFHKKHLAAVIAIASLLTACGSKHDSKNQPVAEPEAPEQQEELHDASLNTTMRPEDYRPQFHYTPQQNWMSAPSGLVYFDGEYHLFYQYNPEANDWGHMSWGHAVSTDLVHWQELPVAIAEGENEMIFSGSIVVDSNNVSGFGDADNPPLVAFYTSVDQNTGNQSQSLAYSTDRGRTWTKYAGNPVIDIGSNDFRDPKVIWYEPEQKWVMAVALAADRKVAFYGSTDLINWDHLSDFGPFNAVASAWEMPDLFQLPVDGDPNNVKWVLAVSVLDGAVTGGSGIQYFIGDFDGTTFTAENTATVADGEPQDHSLLADFEGADYGDWTVTGEAFGTGPMQGSFGGQSPVSNYLGSGLVNSFFQGDRTKGTLTSPTFTLDRQYVSLLVGGGRHPHDPNATLNGFAPEGEIFEDFEGGSYGQWTATGEAFGTAPAQGTLPSQQEVSNYRGSGLVNTFINFDSSVGTLTSPPFQVTRPYINLMVGGGHYPEETAVRLLVDGEVVRSATGANSESLNWVAWDVSEFNGRTAQIEIIDQHTGGWGHILVDHIMFADEPALPISTETAVNLIVNGEVVHSATGTDSESLEWVAWDVSDYQGQQAQIQIVDNNSGDWGHILVDQIILSGSPALDSVGRASWADFGKDNYAAASYFDYPGGKKVWLGWMSNWQYADSVPTTLWRGAQSMPRELGLVTSAGGEIHLVQKPLSAFEELRSDIVHYHAEDRLINEGSVPLSGSGSSGKAMEILAEFELGSATEFGLKVRKGENEETLVGYDVEKGEVFIDRTQSGSVDFHPEFPGKHTAGLDIEDNTVRLRIFVDWSSVEVFAEDGRAVITDLIFPSPTSEGVEIYAKGGNVQLKSLDIWPLKSIWQ